LACREFDVSETCYRYSPKLDEENEQIADLLLGLTAARKTWGFGLCFLYLRNVQGHRWNHIRVYRIYRGLELHLRVKPRKRPMREKPDELAEPEAPNKVWSMDFTADRLGDGRQFRLLNVLDDVSREGLGREPRHISAYTQPGKLQQNAYVERYNRTVRHEWLDLYIFESIEEVQQIPTEWLWSNNHERPNIGNGGTTPAQKLRMAA
jgi:putative transposase